jgi:hypothetical protein
VKDIGARDIIIGAIVLLAFGLTVYTTATMTLNIAKRNQDAAIANAVSVALEQAEKPALTCIENRLLESVTRMAENGVRLKGYQMKLEIGNMPVSDPWR